MTLENSIYSIRKTVGLSYEEAVEGYNTLVGVQVEMLRGLIKDCEGDLV